MQKTMHTDGRSLVVTSTEKRRLSFCFRRLTVCVLCFGFLVNKKVRCAPRPSVALCVKYTPENGTLACVCQPVDCFSEKSLLYWLNQTTTSAALLIRNVSKADNGKQFVCHLICGGSMASATHTLQVAYGPYPEKMSILGTAPFITDGTRVLKLTCQARDVNPTPKFSWTDSLCQNSSSTCSFVPKPPDDDGKTVTCRAFNEHTFRRAVKELVLNLMSPPLTPPVMAISSSQSLRAADTLNCTVTGGKPLVEAVTLYCRNPHQEDRADVRSGTSVTSAVVFDASQMTREANMTCYCHAYWRPEPGLYSIHVSASFRADFRSRPFLASCGEYIKENASTTCTCTHAGCYAAAMSVSWLKQATASSALVIANVRREDSGQQFVCQLDCGGNISTTTYTLRVAYGPYPDKMSITGTVPFTTDGTRVLNLTCRATDVSPTPEHLWTDTLCHNSSSTCSFVPKPPGDDGKTVTCRAFNKHTYRAAEKELVLNLIYPPLAPPNITSNTSGTLRTRDTLSCTVTGGKPLVQSVDFHCTNPDHGDRADTVTSTSVTSSLTVDTSQARNEGGMACYCSAYWQPEPGLYSGRSVATFQTDFLPASNTGAIAGGIVGGLLLLAVSVGAVMVVRRNKLASTNRGRVNGNATDTGDNTSTPQVIRDPDRQGLRVTRTEVSAN